VVGRKQPLLLDFENLGNSPEHAAFGDFQSTLPGATFIFPAAASAAGESPPLGLGSDVTAGDWHIIRWIEAD
jgi:hypothetical protein